MSMGSSQSDRAISQELQSWTMDAAGLSPHREGDERISPFILLSFSELSCWSFCLANPQSEARSQENPLRAVSIDQTSESQTRVGISREQIWRGNETYSAEWCTCTYTSMLTQICPYARKCVLGGWKKNIWFFFKRRISQLLPLALFGLYRLLSILFPSNSNYWMFEE